VIILISVKGSVIEVSLVADSFYYLGQCPTNITNTKYFQIKLIFTTDYAYIWVPKVDEWYRIGNIRKSAIVCAYVFTVEKGFISRKEKV